MIGRSQAIGMSDSRRRRSLFGHVLERRLNLDSAGSQLILLDPGSNASNMDHEADDGYEARDFALRVVDITLPSHACNHTSQGPSINGTNETVSYID